MTNQHYFFFPLETGLAITAAQRKLKILSPTDTIFMVTKLPKKLWYGKNTAWNIWNKKQDINRNITIRDHTVFFKCLWTGDALPN